MTRYGPLAALVLMGAGWGLTQPLTKIAVSQGHEPLGLIFWQLVIGAVALFAFRRLSGKPVGLPREKLWFFLMIAAMGTVLPNSFSYKAAANLPSGVMSVVISMVPIFAFPIALGLRSDRFSWTRLLGLLTGLCGVVLLVGPESLPDPAMVWWVPIALIAPLCYSVEGNVVAKWGMHGLGPGHVLFGACVVGAVIALPLAVASGQYINPIRHWGAPEWAMVAASLIHVAVYTGYVWLVSAAGAVFAAQVAYLVTGFGVCWAMVLLGESYSPYFWAAMGMILIGMFLVQPRRTDGLAPTNGIGQDARQCDQ